MVLVARCWPTVKAPEARAGNIEQLIALFCQTDSDECSKYVARDCFMLVTSAQLVENERSVAKHDMYSATVAMVVMDTL